MENQPGSASLHELEDDLRKMLGIGDPQEENNKISDKKLGNTAAEDLKTTKKQSEDEVPEGMVKLVVPPPPVPESEETQDEKEKNKSEKLKYPYNLRPIILYMNQSDLDHLLHKGLKILHHINPRFSKAFFHCRLCSFHISSISEAFRHIKDKNHINHLETEKLKKTGGLLPRPSDSMVQAFDRLLLKIFAENRLSDEDIELRLKMAKILQQQVESHMPGITLRYYGSSFTGLGLKDSDINVGLVLNKDDPPSGIALASALHMIKCIPYWTDIEEDFTAKVPILRFRCAENGLKMSLVIDNSISHQTSVLLQQYANLERNFKVLTVALRVWAQMTLLDQPELGTLPPHAFTIMALYFLQQKKIVPVLHELKKTEEENSYLSAAEYRELEPKPKLSKASLGQLWLDLLHFYGLEFPYESKTISVRFSKPLSRADKNWGNRRIAIEDPFRTNANMGSVMSTSESFAFLKRCFLVSYVYFGTPQLGTGPLFTEVVKSNTEKIGGEAESKIMTASQAAREMAKISAEDLRYEFQTEFLTGGKTLPVICSVCSVQGHGRRDCPELQIPSLGPAPPVDVRHLHALDAVCWNVFKTFAPKQMDMEKRELIRKELQEYVQQKWSDAHLLLFGSSANGFGFADSDVDLCMVLTSNPEGKDLDFGDIVTQLGAHLRRNPNYSDVVHVSGAKVPIVKFVHKPTRLEGDISLYNRLGLWNSRLLSCYAAIDSRVRVIGFMAKVLAKQCDVGDASRGSLSSYAYTLLAIHYLQRVNPPIIPVLQELSSPGNPKQQRIVDGCDTWFFEELQNIKHVWPYLGQNQQPVSTLWLGFLHYFAQIFNYTQQVVCIRQMKPLFRLEKMWNDRPIAIEDPFELAHNLGAGVCPRMGAYIRRVFVLSTRWFQTPIVQVPKPFRTAEEYLFYRANIIKDPAPKNERGCNNCGRIGHKAKDCLFDTQNETPASNERNKPNKKPHHKNPVPANAGRRQPSPNIKRGVVGNH